MSKWHGIVGYVKEVAGTGDERGIWKTVPEEHIMAGEVISRRSRWSDNNNVNGNINIINELSILLDQYSYENFPYIKYAQYMGTMWNVESAEIKEKRIILKLGGVYNGPRPIVSSEST